MRLGNFKMRTKLLSAFLFVVLISAVPLTISIYSLVKMRTAISRIIYESKEALLVKDLKNKFSAQILTGHKYLLTGNAAYLDEIRKTDEQIKILFKEVINIVENQTETDVLQEIKQDIDTFMTISRNIVKLYNENQQIEAHRLMSTDNNVISQKINSALDKFVRDSEADTSAALMDAGEHSQSSMNLLYFSVLISISAFALAIIVAVFLSLSITKPLHLLKTTAEKISMGDLMISVKINQKDEIGELADSFRRMLTAVRFFASEMRKQQKAP